MNKFDIINNVSVVAKFGEALNAYIDSYKKLNGARKRYIPLKFSYKDKCYEIEIYRLSNTECIFENVIYTIAQKFYNFYFTYKFHYYTTYETFSDVNITLNEIYDIEFIDGSIVFKVSENDIENVRINIINEFKKFIDNAKYYKDLEMSTEPDFTNFALTEKSSFNNRNEIEEYLDLVEKYKDELKTDFYTKFSIFFEINSDSYSQTIDTNGLSKDKILEKIDELFGRINDAIGVVPCITGWSTKRFLETPLLSFKVIYTDNHYRVSNHLKKVKDEAICAYYDSKKSGGYCGD